jgi:hypothetical protein
VRLRPRARLLARLVRDAPLPVPAGAALGARALLAAARLGAAQLLEHGVVAPALLQQRAEREEERVVRVVLARHLELP